MGSSRQLSVRIRKHRQFYVLLIPVVAYYIIFAYWPNVYAFIIAFKDLKVGQDIFASQWVGLENFRYILADREILGVIRNTVEISLLRLVFSFFPPILLAVLFYDLRAHRYRTACQTLTYLPHFFSWVIMYGIAYAFFSTGSGFVNYFLQALGFQRIDFLTSQRYIRFVLIFMEVWKELGWSTIIYFATLSSIDPQLFEAAKMDGAGPIARMRAITLPALSPIISLTLSLSLGRVLFAGGEQILLFYNPAVYDVVDIIDTWVYRVGLGSMKLSRGTAVNLFQALVGMVLILISNAASKKITGNGIW